MARLLGMVAAFSCRKIVRGSKTGCEMSRPDVDPYEILGLARGASWDQIRTTYRRLAKKHHPDKNPGDPASEWIFKQVNQAYERLRDMDRVHDEEATRPSRSSPVRGFDRQDRELRARARPEDSREEAPMGGHRRSGQPRKARPAAWSHRSRRPFVPIHQDPKEWGKTAAMLAALLLFAYAFVPEARRCFFGCDASVGDRNSTNTPIDALETESIRDPFLEDYIRERLQADLGEPTTASRESSTGNSDVLDPTGQTSRYGGNDGGESHHTADMGANTRELRFFSQDSHEDDVVRLQGTPTEIQGYSVLGYETWYYGRNKVTISTATRRVTEWSNPSGTLKVRMVPGPNVTGSEFFSRGSHEDDVVRLQGTPTEIQGYSVLGYETWYYGRSNVTISTTTRRVTEWSNSSGILKVRMVPGAGVTGSEFFSRGSHEDDVLRLQGTPTEIQGYSVLGYEVWYYGRSKVTISTATRRVTEWSNSNGTLKVRMMPVPSVSDCEFCSLRLV